MTSKTSLIKKGILYFQLKRFWWIAGFHALLLFLVTPFRILSTDKKYLLERLDLYPHTASGTLLNDVGMFILLMGGAVLLGIAMFRYMQNVRSATLLHALPVKRRELYISSLLSGLILLIAPLLLNGFILLLMYIFGGYGAVLSPVFILDWLGGQLLTGMAVFCFTFFVGVLTGSSVAQFVFTFVFCFLPVSLMGLFSYLLEDWLFGFTNAGLERTLEILLKITPMYYPQFLCREPIWWIPVLEGVYILLFAALGLYLYDKRDVERAGDIASFNFMAPLFLYGASFCVMVLGTCFVRSVGSYGGAPQPVVMLLFALLGYGVAKALLLKSFRILPYYKGYLLFATVILLLYGSIHFNVFGFGTRVPAVENIQQAYVGYHYTHEWNEERDPLSGSTQFAIFGDEESLNAVTALHQRAIEGGKLSEKEARAQDKQAVYFSYETKSGGIITRAYYMKSEELFDLFSTKAAKDSMYQNIRLYPERIKYIEAVHDRNIEIYGEEKEELLSCIRKDLDRLSYIELNKHHSLIQYATGNSYDYDDELLPEDKVMEEESGFVRSLVFAVEFAEGDRNVWFEYNENFTETVNWIQKKGYWQE